MRTEIPEMKALLDSLLSHPLSVVCSSHPCFDFRHFTRIVGALASLCRVGKSNLLLRGFASLGEERIVVLRCLL